jgi:hypothetical protein
MYNMLGRDGMTRIRRSAGFPLERPAGEEERGVQGERRSLHGRSRRHWEGSEDS